MDAIKPGAVIFAKNVEALVRFYEQLVPMRVMGEDHGAIYLETDAIQLVVHPLPKAVSKQIEIATPPAPRQNSAIKLIFAVDSLDRVRADAPTLGGALKPASAAFTSRGFRACDGNDPEGNVIQFRESAA